MAIGFAAIAPKPLPTGALTKQKIERAMQTWSGAVHKKVASYPPQAPTRYRRTGTLGRGWVHYYGTEAGNLVAVVSNGVRYASWVQDEKRQTAVMHAKGWPTVQEIGRAMWKTDALGPIKEALKHPS